MMRGGLPRGGFGASGYDSSRGNRSDMRSGSRGFGTPNDRMYGGRYGDSGKSNVNSYGMANDFDPNGAIQPGKF